jgi:leader peptidase (prepilin peptidase)/N-methyltransferase
MFPEWTWIVGLMIGAAIGSFLNVVIYRMPRLLSLGKPKHSFCPNCKHQLDMADLVPLFSWIMSGGKCRHCTEKVPSRYFWVELITGSLWAAIWYRYFCADPTGSQWVLACFYLAATAALVAIIFIDGEHFIIPDEINAFLLFLGIGFAIYSHDWKFLLYGYLMGWGIIFAIAFFGRIAFGKDAMGHGDIKMMRGVGALLGPILTIFDVGIAVVTGLVFGLLFMAIQSIKDSKAKALADANGESSEVIADDDEEYEPEPIKDLFILGMTYLFCFDIVAIWFPQIYGRMGYPVEDVSVEDDDWQPSLSTIPFGPYLAIGAIVCMLMRTELSQYAENVLRALNG